MTNKPRPKPTTLLSIPKTTVYLGLAVLGIFLKQINQPGNIFFLAGTGLFFGHLCYRCVAYKQKLILRIVLVVLATAIMFTVMILKFNIINASAIFAVFVGIALLIEWITKAK